MAAGLSTAQAIHAALRTFLTASPSETLDYLSPESERVVVLTTDDEPSLRHLHKQAMAARLPCALWTEDEFPGQKSTVATALGIGPAARDLIRPITKGLKPMK